MIFEPSEDDIDWDIEARHLDEAEFYVQMWEDAFESPNYTLQEIAAGPEQRMLAHVEALQAGGSVVFSRLLAPTIEDPDAEYERVAASVLASSHLDHAVRVLSTAAQPQQRHGILRALESCTDPRLDSMLVDALGNTPGEGLPAVLELLARRRVSVDGSLRQYLHRDDIDVVRSAAWLARHCTDRAALADLTDLTRTNDPRLLRIVIETALLRGVAGAWDLALYWACISTPSPIRRDALTWVALLGDAAVHDRLFGLLDIDALRADVVWAMGFTGRVAAVDRCVELLDDEQLGPLAAEVVGAITGLRVDEPPFAKPPTPPPDDDAQDLPALHDDDLDADLAPTPEAALPSPDPDAISRWWQEHRGHFDPVRRHLGGELLSARVLVEALWRSPARRRHVLALELALRTGGMAAVDTRLLSRLQAQQLEALPELGRVDFQRGYPAR